MEIFGIFQTVLPDCRTDCLFFGPMALDLYATTPAKVNGLFPQKGSLCVGADADVVIFDPDYKGIFTVNDMLHEVDYCSYEGMEQIGRVDTVFLRGKKVVGNGEYIGRNGDGEWLKGRPFGLLYQ